MTDVLHNPIETLDLDESTNKAEAPKAAPTQPSSDTGQDAAGSHEETTASLRALLDAGANRNWTAEALCTGKTHLFFAPPGERMTRRTKREALANSYCEQCSVSTECRTWARENRESGFWGGENEEQRAAAGFAPRSPNRRAVAIAARAARDAS